MYEPYGFRTTFSSVQRLTDPTGFPDPPQSFGPPGDIQVDQGVRYDLPDPQLTKVRDCVRGFSITSLDMFNKSLDWEVTPRHTPVRNDLHSGPTCCAWCCPGYKMRSPRHHVTTPPVVLSTDH